MSEYYWDNKIEYLKNTRWLYYNDDYLEFLVKVVWKIEKPVKLIDFGCGYGYLGLKLLPMLPEGSSYTGIDKGPVLIDKAKELFKDSPYVTRFIVEDIMTRVIEPKYDIALCHALLLHVTDTKLILQRMMDSVVDHGRVICFEPNWIAGMSTCHLDGIIQSQIVSLGVLQKLYESSMKLSGKDGNIGIKVPMLMSQLDLKDVECRVSDKVNFLDQNMENDSKNSLYSSLMEDGMGAKPNEEHEFVRSLIDKGLSEDEAFRQYYAEKMLYNEYSNESWLTYAPNMKISFGVVQR